MQRLVKEKVGDRQGNNDRLRREERRKKKRGVEVKGEIDSRGEGMETGRH